MYIRRLFQKERETRLPGHFPENIPTGRKNVPTGKKNHKIFRGDAVRPLHGRYFHFTFNHLRELSNVYFGARRNTLLQFYNTLLQTKMDYSASIHGPEAPSILKCLKT